MTSDCYKTKLVRNVLIGLLFLNLSSVLIQKNGGTFNNISYVFRIIFYVYVLKSIHSLSVPQKLKKNIFIMYGLCAPVFLTFSLSVTLLSGGASGPTISRIFPTYFMLADTMLFFYIGFSVERKHIQLDSILKYLHSFAILSIAGMSVLSIYVSVKFGGLRAFWSEAYSANDAYYVILNVFKNVNPYRFAVLMPFLFLIRSKLSVPFVVIAFLNIVFAGKKGPLLASTVAGLFVFWQLRGGRMKFVKYLIIGSAMFLVYYVFIDNTIFDSLIYRLDPSQHMKKDDATFYTSGRDYLWKYTLEHFFSGGLVHQFCGYGINGAADFLTKKTGISNVHNDWLEVLHNFGYIGFFAMLNLYLVLAQFCKKLRKINKKYYIITLYLLVFSFVTSFYTVQCYGGFVAPGYSYLLIAFFYGIYANYKINNETSFGRQGDCFR